MAGITDFVIRFKNASLANRREVLFPFSNINKKVADLLAKEGYLEKVSQEVVEGRKIIKGTIKYENRKPVLTDVKLVSKPSLRIYEAKKNLRKFKRGNHTVIVSTSKGIMTGDKATKEGLGGEVLFEIW
jgi:small subunit ribosomal protein S8